MRVEGDLQAPQQLAKDEEEAALPQGLEAQQQLLPWHVALNSKALHLPKVASKQAHLHLKQGVSLPQL